MKKYLLLCIVVLWHSATFAQLSDPVRFPHNLALPGKHIVQNPPYGTGPTNNHLLHKETAGGTTYSDWYDLWDEMYDTTSLSLTHSYLFYYDVYPDSNLYDTSYYYPPYHVFTHGMGMSFDPTDSAYYYNAYNPAYRVTAPFPYTLSYKLDSFWVPGQYMRYDLTPGNVDSLVVEFIVTQAGGLVPDSGCYPLIMNPADNIYRPCAADETPRFATPRYIRAADECIDPVYTKTTHQRYAFPLTITDAFIYKKVKFGLTTPITVMPGHYLAAYVYFKSQVAYPLVTGTNYANYYWLYAGEPTGINVWYPQSSRNLTTGYPGSHQTGLIATNQIRYADLGFTYGGHNILIPSYAYAHTGANPSSGFDVPQMAFHIKWTVPDTSLQANNINNVTPQISAFPNPCSDVINLVVNLEHAADVTLLLQNISGEVVATRKMGNITSGTANMDVSSLPAGTYFYIMQADGRQNSGSFNIIH